MWRHAPWLALFACSAQPPSELAPPPQVRTDRLAARIDGSLVSAPRGTAGAQPAASFALESMPMRFAEGLDVRRRGRRVEIDVPRDVIDTFTCGDTGPEVRFEQELASRAPAPSQEAPAGQLARLHARVSVGTPLAPRSAVYLDVVEKGPADTVIDRWVSQPLPGPVDRWWRTAAATTMVTIGIVHNTIGPWLGPFGFRRGKVVLDDAELELLPEVGAHAFHPQTGTERIGREVRDSLYAPAGTVRAWRVAVPRGGATFEAGVGSLHGADVRFTVKVDGRTRAQTTAREQWKDLRFSLQGPGEVVIRLETSGPTGACASWSNPVVVAHARKPPRRMVLIDLDSVAMSETSLASADLPTTPWLREMAGRGTWMRNAFSSGIFLLPSHIDLFSGRYEPVSGHLPPGRSFVRKLREAGFATAAYVGGEYLDEGYGFSDGFERWQSHGAWEQHPALSSYLDDSLRFLEGHRARDLFLYLHGFETYAPEEAPARYRAMFVDAGPRAGHRQTLRWLDDSLARWFARAAPMLEGATIVLTSGHGQTLGEHVVRGHRFETYRESVWVPLIAIGPGFTPGRVEDEARSLIDLAPTFLRASGIADDDRDGIALQDRASASRVVTSLGGLSLALRDRHRTLLISSVNHIHAFDRDVDPGELRDLGAAQYPDLHEHAEAFYRARGETVPPDP